jgi:methyl acetate hydrolase
MSKRLLIVVLLILLLPALVTLHTSSGAHRLSTLNAKGAAAIDQMFQAAVSNKEIPGVVAAITNKNQVLYLKSFGSQDVAQNVPMARDTVFRIASMTKPITSVAVMMLVEQGKLRLDDAAVKYLPALKGREVIATFNEKDGTYTTRPAKQEITIQHLLTHTSGFSYSFTSPKIRDIQQKTGKKERDMPLLFDPGSRWYYSHSTAMLGDIVEKITGQTLEDFFRANLFRPLQMVDTSFLLPEEKARRLVTIHRREATGLVETPNPPKYVPLFRADGGLVSTASDYSTFLQMLLNGGSWHGNHILKPETLRLMTSNQIGSLLVEEMPAALPAQSASFLLGHGKDKFGFGFQITVPNGKSVHARSAGSYAWGGIFNTHFWVDPKRGIGVVFLTQELPFNNPTNRDVVKRFEKLIYEHLK